MIKKYPEYFSYSSLTTFFDCSQRYKWQYIEKIKTQEKQSIYGIFGSAIHLLLEKFYKNGIFTREKLIKNWKKVFDREMKKAKFPIIGNSEYHRLLKSGYPMLQNFYSQQKETNQLIKPVAIEKKFKYSYNIAGRKLKTSGKIDLILKINEGYEIIDYKTTANKQQQNNKKVTLQLILYFLAFQKLYKKCKNKNIKVVLHFLRSDTKTYFIITKKDILMAYREIKKYFYGIYNSDFLPTPSKKTCLYCPYREKCSKENMEKINEEGVLKKNIKLYPYQEIDAKKMIQNKTMLVANDMGTGKTLTAIFVGEYLKKNNKIKKILVLTLNTVKYQWARELDKFSKNADYIIIDSNKEERKKQYREDGVLWRVMGYSSLRRDIDFIEKKYDMIILDDPSGFKNWKTKTAEAIKELKAKYKYILYATPITNNLAEIYNFIRFLDFSILGKWFFFDKKYIVRDYFNAIVKYKNIQDFREKIKPILIRRTFDSVIKDIPKAIIKNIYVKMDSGQKEFYNSTVMKIRDYLLENIKGEKANKIINAETLAKFTYLRELCDSPELIGSNEKSAKLEKLKEIVKKIIPQKAIIFSEFAEMVKIIEKNMKNCIIITGRDNVKQKNKKIEEFKNSTIKNILVCTDVLSYGVNLQFVHYLINFDLPFTFAKLSQRMGRERRIGQKNQVMVINLIIKNTVEERILEIVKYKKKLTNILDNKKINKIEITKSDKITNKIIKDILGNKNEISR